MYVHIICNDVRIYVNVYDVRIYGNVYVGGRRCMTSGGHTTAQPGCVLQCVLHYQCVLQCVLHCACRSLRRRDLGACCSVCCSTSVCYCVCCTARVAVCDGATWVRVAVCVAVPVCVAVCVALRVLQCTTARLGCL